MFGEKIRQLRLNTNLTQNKLAKELGLSASAIGMYEQSRRVPTCSMLLQICEFFGVSPDYLLFDNQISCDSAELSDIIKQLRHSLESRKNITFNGRQLSNDEINSVINSINIAVNIALANHN